VDNCDITPGQTVLVTTFGGGFTWAAFLLRF
jgi:3-oxoacyl-[acyl-carrier-protein] synthase-3